MHGPFMRHARAKPDLKAVRLERANRNLTAFKQALSQAQEATTEISYAGVPPVSELNAIERPAGTGTDRRQVGRRRAGHRGPRAD